MKDKNKKLKKKKMVKIVMMRSLMCGVLKPRMMSKMKKKQNSPRKDKLEENAVREKYNLNKNKKNKMKLDKI